MTGSTHSVRGVCPDTHCKHNVQGARSDQGSSNSPGPNSPTVSDSLSENSSRKSVCVKILHYNVRSLLPKMDLLHGTCEAQNPDVICVTETWLGEEIDNSEISLPGYNIIRLDRHRHGGGVAMYVKNTIDYNVILCGPDNLEFLLVSVNYCNCTLPIGLWYRPPNTPTTIFDTLQTCLESFGPSFFRNFIFVGDFNVDFYKTNHPLYLKLNSILCSFSLSQVVTEPTHFSPNGNSSLIDLALMSNPSQLQDCSTIPPLGNSDHCGVSLSIRWKCNTEHVTVNPRKIWRYTHANFERACELLEAVNWDDLISSDINEAWTNWYSKFMEIINECVPKAFLSKRRNLPWLSKDIISAMRRRNTLFRLAKRSNSSSLRKKYRDMRNRITAQMRRAKKIYFRNLRNGGNKAFWKAMKYLNKSNRTTIPSLVYEGKKLTTDEDKATALNQFFSTCFNPSHPPLSPQDTLHTNIADCPPELYCTEDELLEMLLKLDATKASGPDGISNRMLKHTAHAIAPSLTKLFNLSIRTGQVPCDWKTSSVVPIPKSSGASDSIANYRPISLLSVVSKLLERHISNSVSKHLSEHCPLSPCQWGFTPGKSTVSALLSATDHWYRLLESGAEVCAIFFDLKKAFDSVPHRPLLNKLQDMGLNDHLVRWISDYLTDRKQFVVTNGASSVSSVPIISGVPQGSVLGPLLFNIYINGVANSTSDG